MWAISLAARAAISRTTVRIVPSAGSRTEPYARSAARAMAAAVSTGSTSSPGREMSSSAAPRISWLRMTPLLPRAPSSAARATESTIWLRPISSISPCVERLSSSCSTARSVSAMLSPVSPSATGKTFRSLTSSRRDSNCASAASITRRNRRRLGSATGFRGLLSGLGYLAGLEAARADVDALGSAGLNDPDLLDVDVETALGRDHRVRAALTKGRALAAGVTDSSHRAGEYRTPVAGYRVRDAFGDTGPHLPAGSLPRGPPSRQRRHGECLGGARRAAGPRGRGQAARVPSQRGRARAPAVP